MLGLSINRGIRKYLRSGVVAIDVPYSVISFLAIRYLTYSFVI